MSAFHPFSIVNPTPGDDDAVSSNWRVLQEATRTYTYTPVFTGTQTGGGVAQQPNQTSAGMPIGTYTFYGPMVFMHVEFFLTAGWKWIAGTTMTLPTTVMRATPIAVFNQNPPIVVAAGAAPLALNQYGLILFTSLLQFPQAYAPTATNDYFSIDFFYYRK